MTIKDSTVAVNYGGDRRIVQRLVLGLLFSPPSTSLRTIWVRTIRWS